MIITSIKAENVLKYKALDLPDLPEKGVIAISGKNESGKSTIGETVCFALFGRTFSLGEYELDKVVHWGAGGCSVALTFRIGDNDHYKIERFLDKEGTHSAKFSRLGEEDMPIARGVEGVADALFLVLGYDFEEFVDSFYLAQREITAPQPHSQTVKAMAGIAALEVVGDQFDEEIAELEDTSTMSRFRTDEIDAELTALAIKDGHLDRLENELDQVKAAESENNDKIEQLKTDSSSYRETVPDIQAVRRSITSNSTARFLFLIAAVVFGAVWAAFTQYPDHEYSLLIQQTVQQQLPEWNEQHLQGVQYLAIALAVLFVFVQIRVFSLKSKLKDLMHVASQLATTLENTRQQSVVVGDSVLDEDVEEAVEDTDANNQEIEENSSEADALADELGSEDSLQVARPTDDEIARLCSRVSEASISGSDVDNIVEREIDWTREENSRLNTHHGHLERAIYDEKQRLKLAANLNEEKTALLEKIGDAEARINIRQLANELLEGASGHMSSRFNNDVRDLVSRTLPLFTEGRYEHLQIDNDMSVSVFSGEKRDFLDLEEVSSGTQRQIMLALRLALSQELVNRSVEGEQFIFLDEPFAFFDEARTKSSLKVLPDLSDEINQIFVVGQEFPAENISGFSKHIECFREIDSV
jgi:DNA repair protein SbcC/Rad50